MNKFMPAFREYSEVFQLFHLSKIFHGMKKEQKNAASDDLPDREGVRPPKQGGGRGKDTRKGGCRRNRRWERGGGSGRVGSLRRGCILRFTLGYLARPIGKGMDFSMARLETERDDGSVHDETKIIYSLHTRVLRELREFIENKHSTIYE